MRCLSSSNQRPHSLNVHTRPCTRSFTAGEGLFESCTPNRKLARRHMSPLISAPDPHLTLYRFFSFPERRQRKVSSFDFVQGRLRTGHDTAHLGIPSAAAIATLPACCRLELQSDLRDLRHTLRHKSLAAPRFSTRHRNQPLRQRNLSTTCRLSLSTTMFSPSAPSLPFWTLPWLGVRTWRIRGRRPSVQELCRIVLPWSWRRSSRRSVPA